MLKNVQEIKWENLKHAYGSADDIPQLLQILNTKNRGLVDKAISALFGNIYHQVFTRNRQIYLRTVRSFENLMKFFDFGIG